MKNWNRWTATKETARSLRAQLLAAVPLELPHIKEDLLAFLNACEARLPSSAAVDADVARKRTGKQPLDAEDLQHD